MRITIAMRVEYPELPGGAAFFEEVDQSVLRHGVPLDALKTMYLPAALECGDFRQSLGVYGVPGNEVEVGLDVCADLVPVGIFVADVGSACLCGDSVNRVDDLREQFRFSGEMIGDHPGAAEAGTSGDLFEGCPGVSELGDCLDCCLYYLGPPGLLGEGTRILPPGL
nr:hypothetical protein [Streptomyces sp. TRM68367]